MKMIQANKVIHNQEKKMDPFQGPNVYAGMTQKSEKILPCIGLR